MSIQGHLRCPPLVVPTTNAHEILSLHTDVFAVIQTCSPPDVVRRVPAVDNSLPVVEVCSTAESCQPYVVFKAQCTHNLVSNLVVEGSSRDRYALWYRGAAVKYRGSEPQSLQGLLSQRKRGFDPRKRVSKILCPCRRRQSFDNFSATNNLFIEGESGPQKPIR